VLVAVGCSSYALEEPPVRAADLYPLSGAEDGVTVAVDQIAEVARVERYFGADLLAEGILPVQIVVSNRGQRHVAVRPEDVLLVRDSRIVDPLRILDVTTVLKRRGLGVTRETKREIDAFFESLAFKETVVAPGESYHGILFFDAPPRAGYGRSRFRLLDLYLPRALELRLAVTDLETGDRLRFGPFVLSPS
jgi:hypothetical protein